MRVALPIAISMPMNQCTKIRFADLAFLTATMFDWIVRRFGRQRHYVLNIKIILGFKKEQEVEAKAGQPHSRCLFRLTSNARKTTAAACTASITWQKRALFR